MTVYIAWCPCQETTEEATAVQKIIIKIIIFWDYFAASGPGQLSVITGKNNSYVYQGNNN